MINERVTAPDPDTGLQVTRWTDHASNHPYFTNPGWFDGNRQFLIASDRRGLHDLVALDLPSGDQRPVTRIEDGQGIEPSSFCVCPRRNCAYGWVDRKLEQIDLLTGDRRVLFALEPGWNRSMVNVTADGMAVCFGICQQGDVTGFEEIFAMHPLCRIHRLHLDSGGLDLIHERQVWLGHINTAPGHPERISFCHEGPWTQVENRVWCAEMDQGRVWKVCETPGPPACVGHEYWLADGRRIAYHGFDSAAQPVLGVFDVETGKHRQVSQPVKTKHSHSLDGEWIVGDGSEAMPWILLWHLTDDGLQGPWKLCRHDGGWSEQRRHVHPRIAPDGNSIWFTSDAGGIPRVYSVEMPTDPAHVPRL